MNGILKVARFILTLPITLPLMGLSWVLIWYAGRTARHPETTSIGTFMNVFDGMQIAMLGFMVYIFAAWLSGL
jgi:hypothetical protein